jgi:hypothetical protein
MFLNPSFAFIQQLPMPDIRLSKIEGHDKESYTVWSQEKVGCVTAHSGSMQEMKFESLPSAD